MTEEEKQDSTDTISNLLVLARLSAVALADGVAEDRDTPAFYSAVEWATKKIESALESGAL